MLRRRSAQMTAKPENRSEAIAEMLAAAGVSLIGLLPHAGTGTVALSAAEAPDERTLRFRCTCRSSWRKPVRHNYDVALSAEDTVKAFGQAGELSKEVRIWPEPTITGYKDGVGSKTATNAKKPTATTMEYRHLRHSLLLGIRTKINA